MSRRLITGILANGGAAGDVTVDPMDWNDGNGPGLSIINDTPYPQVSGISVPVDLSLSWTIREGSFTVYRRNKNGSFILCTENPTVFEVIDGDQPNFLLLTEEFTLSTGDFTVTNVTDGNTVLDTFALSAEGVPE